MHVIVHTCPPQLRTPSPRSAPTDHSAALLCVVGVILDFLMDSDATVCECAARKCRAGGRGVSGTAYVTLAPERGREHREAPVGLWSGGSDDPARALAPFAGLVGIKVRIHYVVVEAGE